MSETIYNHDYRLCNIDDCRECQEMVDNGFILACDECGMPGSADSEWTLLKDGRTLCISCSEKLNIIDEEREGL